jgi:hypothetical protein
MKQISAKILLLLCLLSLYLSAEVVPLPGLLHPDSITLDNGRIYITDLETIYIFSAAKLQLIKKFGKKGEGPGEFKFNPAGVAKLVLDLHPDTIMVNSMGRVSFFTGEGNYVKEVPVASGNDFKQVDTYWVGYSTSRDNKILYATINLYDSGFKKLKEIYRKEYYVQPSKKFNLVKLGCGNARRAVYRVYNEKIFVEGEEDTIHVFNKEGNEEYVIKLNDETLKISEKHKEEILKDLFTLYTGPTMQDLIKAKGYFPEYFPARVFHIADNKIFLPTYKKQAGKNEFIVLDLKGNLIKKIYLPFADRQLLLPYPYAIRDGRFYQLVDNEETQEWELHITSGW